MATLRDEIVKDLIVIETDLGSPTFTWKSTNYIFTPSVAEFRRELETGGYSVEKMLTSTVRKLTSASVAIFTTYPTPQDLIIYNIDNEQYRIESIKHDPTGAYFRLIATSNTKGI